MNRVIIIMLFAVTSAAVAALAGCSGAAEDRPPVAGDFGYSPANAGGGATNDSTGAAPGDTGGVGSGDNTVPTGVGPSGTGTGDQGAGSQGIVGGGIPGATGAEPLAIPAVLDGGETPAIVPF